MSVEATDAAVVTPKPSWARAWKVALSLLAIFVCGAMLGGLVTLRVLRREVTRRSNPANWPVLVLARLDKRLSLTPEQHRAMEPIVREASEEALKIRTRSFSEIGGVVRRAQAKAIPQLSADQQHRLDEFITERADLARRWTGPLVPAAYAVPDSTAPSPASSPAAP